MKERHHKHPPLTRVKRGNYHRLEWAIYGTNCGSISTFYQSLVSYLPALKTFYIDADHAEGDGQYCKQIGNKLLEHPAHTYWNEYDDYFQNVDADVVVVNGNHYPGQKQIVLIDPKKEASLLRRIDELTDVYAIVVKESQEEIFDFLNSKISKDTMVITMGEIQKLYDKIRNDVESRIPRLKALILAGGKSSRMGKDKSQIDYHGQPMELHLASVCRELGLESHISKPHDYNLDVVGECSVIKDKMPSMGPFGAIISAMMSDPESAWLVLACDLPNLDLTTLQTLIDKRNPSKVATAVRGHGNPFPEPLISIYEPRAYPRMLQFLSLGYACPRKVLINSDVSLWDIDDNEVILNVNTVEEKKAFMAQKMIDG